MSAGKRDQGKTLAEALDATRWDFRADPEQKMLLRPVGAIFENLPWEARAQYLGPAPIEENDNEDHVEGADTPKSPDDKA